tara:strand:- start:1634 stop:3358 length:1725 start_codon:yes stop_codon:yes gene_type:complete
MSKRVLNKVKSSILKPEDINIDSLRHLSKDSFPLWALTSGVKIDSNFVDFDKHRYLLPIYMDPSREVVWQKAAQLGATSYMLLRIVWWLQQNPGTKACLYFPTREGVDNLSADRLTPLLESCALTQNLMQRSNKLSLRRIGNSTFYLLHLGGQASKDSMPLDFVAFDEVRLCNAQDIDQALERISHSVHKYKLFMSTAGIPSQDISARFDLGTQHIYMSKCGCSSGVDLARTFPHCVVDDPKRGLYLRCPKCRYIIKNPQNGRYIAHNPGANYPSYHVSQLVSRFISLEEVWDSYKRTTNMEEFFNAKLGLPFIDEANRGIGKAQLDACIDPGLSWGKSVGDGKTAMGIDQGGGYNVVVIADLHEGKKRIRHVEIIERNNPDYMVNGKLVSPFHRVHELMDEYDVRLCVCDAMPNYNEALAFAQEFPGRVFLAWYQREAKQVVAWGDKKKVPLTMAKAGPLLKFKYVAVLSRFLSLSVALGEWADSNVVCPDPEGLVQMCRDEKTNQLRPQEVSRRLFDHLMRLIKRFKVTNHETGEGRTIWSYVGGDPHLAHAWNYTNVALERLRRHTSFTFF